MVLFNFHFFPFNSFWKNEPAKINFKLIFYVPKYIAVLYNPKNITKLNL